MRLRAPLKRHSRTALPPGYEQGDLFAGLGTPAAAPPSAPEPPPAPLRARANGSSKPAARPRPAGPAKPLPSGATARARANVAALTVLRRLEDQHRDPHDFERAVLEGFTGWGACAEVFDDSHQEFAWAREQLAPLMTPADLRAAARSTLNAHYTDPAVIEAMWAAAGRLGFTGGRILEPGCGAGRFMRYAPGDTQITGVELDPVSAGIAAVLNPDHNVRAESFADTRISDGYFDGAVGNVPFDDVKLLDKRHNPGGHSIHNHFIIKALHLTRPGGIVMVLTSRYTLDAGNPAARREMASLADLLGAVRLPSGSHQAAAGTKAILDLLIFRRRDPLDKRAAQSWEQARDTEVDGATVKINTYFLDHPGSVLGVMHTGAGGGMYRADDLEVRPWPGSTPEQLAASLNDTLTVITSAAAETGQTWATRTRETPDQAAPPPVTVDQDGHITAAGAGYTTIENGIPVPFKVPGSQARELTRLLALRDTLRALLDAENATADDTPQMDALRARLSDLYTAYAHAHGPLNRFRTRPTGRFHGTCPACDTPVRTVRKNTQETATATGYTTTCPKCRLPVPVEPAMAQIRPPQGGFRRDPHSAVVYALEIFDPADQTAERAPIFTQRICAPRAPRLGADTAGEALRICLDAHGSVRLDEIARLLGTGEAEARNQLGTLVFEDPDLSDPDAPARLVPAAEYLSGKVRQKLQEAETAANADDRFQVNVDALREVIPQDLRPDEIEARMGAVWIAPAYVQQFLAELLDDRTVKVERPGGQIWAIRGNQHTVLASSTWGTGRRPAIELAAGICEQRQVKVYDKLKDGSQVLNLDATLAASAKAEELSERFTEWCWEKPERAAKLARIYNDRFNGLRLRSYDGTKLTLPGLALTFDLHDHQHAAIARMIHEEAAGIFHSVGAGKTLVMAAGVMELRRLGLIRKACVTVPNHMLEQFAREWLQAYPRAKILVAHKEDLQGPKRTRFVARCVTGDWDAMIISHSAFTSIPMSKDEEEKYLTTEIDQLQEWLDAAEGGDRLTTKRLQRIIIKAEERLKARMDMRRDPGLVFEKLGVDYIVVDELHLFKNLKTPSAIPDAAIEGSHRATDLHMKLCWLRRRYGQRVITGATATPIANSITEAHVMCRYMRPDLLEDADVSVFDSWAATFGQVQTRVELAPEGGESYRLKSRFSAFHNIPELMAMWFVFGDVKLSEDLHLKNVPLVAARPEDGERVTRTIVVPPSPELVGYVQQLGERAKDVRNRAVKPWEDNMLKISSNGRAAAIDLRLVGIPQWTRGKIEAAADEITAIWAAHRDDVYEGSLLRGSLQIVFCDLGTPHPGQWNVYDTLREALVSRGMPDAGIRYVHEANSDRDKAQLFAACRAGHVAVLLGSTERMGVGVNVQTRCVALHHLDAPWRPADVEQRDGRAVRQGNRNKEVTLIRFTTERSFDAYMWQTLTRKARFIHQLMRGRFDVRTMEDIGDTALSYAEVTAITTGNPLLLEKAEADVELTKLERAERSHRYAQETLRFTISQHEAGIERETGWITRLDAAVERRVSTAGDKFAMTVGETRHVKRLDAGEHLKALLAGEWQMFQANLLTDKAERAFTAGKLGGFTVSGRIWLDRKDGTVVSLELDDCPFGTLTFALKGIERADAVGLVQRLEHLLTHLDVERRDAAAAVARYEREIEHARPQIGRLFPRAADLEAARARCAAIDAELDKRAKAAQAQEAGQQHTQGKENAA